MKQAYRRQAREVALSMLFQMDVGHNDWQMAELTLENAELDEVNAMFAEQLAKGTQEKREQLGLIISGLATSWDLTRMPNVDRNLLLMSCYELEHFRKTPTAIIINEAVEMAKAFSTKESAAFVNAVLDKYAKSLDREEEK
ncbi:MAG: transcription antitermination factor NusB [Clostridia bacterium]|nr:transcription antitermination factor NusB [Clostridia bacterium]MDD4798412.1 transcription antitermination factor NusB [Clostridia bacterium]